MSTVLNMEDFRAIAVIVEDIVEEKVEAAKIQTAAGFAEVHDKIENLTLDVSGIKTELGRVRTDVKNIKTDVNNIKTDVDNMII